MINLNLPYRGFLNFQAYFWILGLYVGSAWTYDSSKNFLVFENIQQYFCDDKDDDAIGTNVMSNDFVLHHKLYIMVGIIGGT